MAARKNNSSRKFLVSACLAGENCTYSGRNKLCPEVRKLVEEGLAVAVCPELAGGSGVPRERCEITGGDGNDVLEKRARVITVSGADISEALISGAQKTLETARQYKVEAAILKSKSPSCGCGSIYDGTFRGVLIKGDGVTTAMLRKNGIIVHDEGCAHVKK